jgi:TetR/AcrR family transcriptional regulator, cholesterol catabolism regulator
MDNRERIIESAAELFRVYGIKSVTMDSLAIHLAISKRTIYEVFADKEELLVGVLIWMTEKQKELIKKVLNESGNAIAAIFKLLEINMDHFQQMSPAFRNDLKKFHYEVLIKKVDQSELPGYNNNLEIIEKGIKEKLFRKDINAELVNRCIFYMGRTIMDDDLYPFNKFSRRDVIRNILINFLKGISTPKGLELIKKLERKF